MLPTPSATEQGSTLGAQLAHAIASRDAAALGALLATPVVFRAVTPRRFWDAETPVGVTDIVLGTWFDESRPVTALAALETGTVGDVERVGYRMDVQLDSGPAEIEQVAYYKQEEGRITELRLVCSGFLPR